MLVATFAAGHSKTARARGAADSAEPLRLLVPGAPDAFYYRPRARGLQPVLMYLHGRGGNPKEDCRKWARVAASLGWLVCPQGAEDRGGGARSWMNNIPSSQRIVDKTLAALRVKHKKRVRAGDNLLIGFSEGAFVAMQVGVHDPSTWSRWLILAADDQYWLGDGTTALHDNRKQIRRVFLLTGEHDPVAARTVRVGQMVKAEKIVVRVRIEPGMGHEVPADRMGVNYRLPLLWLLGAR